jgi:hypothetical protein
VLFDPPLPPTEKIKLAFIHLPPDFKRSCISECENEPHAIVDTVYHFYAAMELREWDEPDGSDFEMSALVKTPSSVEEFAYKVHGKLKIAEPGSDYDSDSDSDSA